jgi:hypothetical protein
VRERQDEKERKKGIATEREREIKGGKLVVIKRQGKRE